MLNEKSRAFFRWKEKKLRWKKDDVEEMKNTYTSKSK